VVQLASHQMTSTLASGSYWRRDLDFCQLSSQHRSTEASTAQPCMFSLCHGLLVRMLNRYWEQKSNTARHYGISPAYSGSICNAMWLTGRDLNMYLVRGPKHRLAVLFWSWLLTCLVIGHSPCSCFLWQNRATEMSKVSACFHLYQQAHWCVT
jgi:hypothetical protein